MMPLRAAMPITVTSPTSEPSDSTPPVRNAAAIAPTSANGSVRNTSAVSRTVPKSVSRIRRMPTSATAAPHQQRSARCRARGVLAEHFGVIAGAEIDASRAAPRCRAPPSRDRGRDTLQVTSIRRDAVLARDLVLHRHDRRRRRPRSAARCRRPAPASRIARTASMLPRASGAPQTTTSKNALILEELADLRALDEGRRPRDARRRRSRPRRSARSG